MNSYLDIVKKMIGITGTDADDVLNWIISSAETRLKVLLGGVDTVPEQLEHIIVEVSIIRYNRIGSEGNSSHTVNAETVNFESNDFAGYMDEIEAYLSQTAVTNRGKIKFL